MVISLMCFYIQIPEHNLSVVLTVIMEAQETSGIEAIRFYFCQKIERLDVWTYKVLLNQLLARTTTLWGRRN